MMAREIASAYTNLNWSEKDWRSNGSSSQASNQVVSPTSGDRYTLDMENLWLTWFPTKWCHQRVVTTLVTPPCLLY